MPETVIYDHKGREVFHKHGVTSVVELKLIIDEILVGVDLPPKIAFLGKVWYTTPSRRSIASASSSFS